MPPEGVKAASGARLLRCAAERGRGGLVEALVYPCLSGNASVNVQDLRQQFRYRTLAAFRLAVETGSVTRSAEELGVTQPAVSQILAGLERSVGFPLFSRGPARRLEPTAEALELHRAVCLALDAIGRVEATVKVLSAATHLASAADRWASEGAHRASGGRIS